MERPTSCTVEGCKRVYRAKGFCRVHYNKWRKGDMPKKARYKTCAKEDCLGPLYRWGICETHYLKAIGKEPKPEATPTAAETTAPAPEAPATEEAPAE
jgi:hypothetical protein